MTDPMDHNGTTTRRLDRVETEVGQMQASIGEMRSEIRSVVTAIGEIKDAFKGWQSQQQSERVAAKPNVVAIVAVLVTVISALIGGAWVVGGQSARLDERDLQRDRQMARMQSEVDRIESRQWRRQGE